MSFIKCSLIVLVVVLNSAVLAAEGGEGGEGGSKKQKKETSPAIEYVEKTTKLNTLRARIDDAQKEFDKLVDEKEHETDPKRVEVILNAMLDIKKRLNKDTDEYESVRRDLIYRYPAKNAELNQLYETREKKTMDDMQSGADLDDMLSRIRRVIDKKFASFMPEDKKTVKAPQPPPEDDSKKLKLEK